MELYKTDNSVPSSAMPDAWDNNRIQDAILNGDDLEVELRTGEKTLSRKGMEKQHADDREKNKAVFDQSIVKFNIDMNSAIISAGYVFLDSFQKGVSLLNNEITLRNQAVRDERTGEYYVWGATLPKKVIAGSTPESTGGVITPEKPTGDWIGVGSQGFRGYVDSEVKPLASFKMAQSANTVIDSGDCSILSLGDSIMTGVGATAFNEKNISKFFRSVWNHVDKGLGKERGYGYESHIEMAQAIREEGVSTTGSIVAQGLVSSRLKLTAGQSLSVTLREIAYLDCIYDAATTTGDIEIYRNGVLVKTVVTDKTAGLKTTFSTAIAGGGLTAFTDTCQIVAKGGDVTVTALLTFKRSTTSPIGFVASRSGWAIQSYTSNEKLTEIAYYLNLFRSAGKKLLILNLGTNNIYNPDMSVTPDGYVALLTTFVNGLKAKLENVYFAIAIPPKSTETRWPALKGKYEKYVEVITKFCNDGNHLLIRHNETTLSETGAYYTDGVHPNNDGHSIMAQTLCRTFGIPYNPNRKMARPVDPEYNAIISGSGVTPPVEEREVANLNVTTGWGPLASFNVHTVVRRGERIAFTGIIAPKEGETKTVMLMTLPDSTKYPIGRDINTLALSNLGAVSIQVLRTGVIRLAASEAIRLADITWISFEMVSYERKQNF